ncbi:DUF4254 domain-containing protein [Nocardia noduli]|uniref:DUF4254 domain-containing protein n=1 Tax=Nocardia noduli TaxID=2815722 RepID=UPI0034D54786
MSGVDDSADPLLNSAVALYLLHGRSHKSDCEPPSVVRRLDIVAVVDAWIGKLAPQPIPGASLHTETMGAVIDRLALNAAVIDCRVDAPAGDIHALERSLESLVRAFDTLRGEVFARTRRLPPTPIALTGLDGLHRYAGWPSPIGASRPRRPPRHQRFT